MNEHDDLLFISEGMAAAMSAVGDAFGALAIACALLWGRVLAVVEDRRVER